MDTRPPETDEMSALRSPRATAWQAERQPHGSFGQPRCAFHPFAMSTDISVSIGTTLHFHSMPQYANFAPKVIDFKRTNWYMWSIWNGNVSTTHQHHREKHRSRMAVLTNHRSLAARRCRQRRLNAENFHMPQPMGSDGGGLASLRCARENRAPTRNRSVRRAMLRTNP